MILKRVLVPLDGSAIAEDILERLSILFTDAQSELILIHALHYSDTHRELYATVSRVIKQRAQEYMAKCAQRLRASGLRCSTRLIEGSPATTILKAAKDEKASLIAISSHGYTGMSRWLLGSVCEKVLRGSVTPVLTARVFAQDHAASRLMTLPRDPYRIRNVLVPMDDSTVSLALLRPVRALAECCGARVSLLHVGETGEATAGPDWLEEARASLETSGIDVAAQARSGRLVEEILSAATDSGADLIAIGSHGRDAYMPWSFGSTAERVLHHARLPVLLNPASSSKTEVALAPLEARQ